MAKPSLMDALSAGPVEKAEPMEGGGEDLDLANDLIEAVKSGDQQGTVDALRALFLSFDSAPHVEGGE